MSKDSFEYRGILFNNKDFKDELIKIKLEYVYHNEIHTREEEVRGFILRNFFKFRLPISEGINYEATKPISIILPKELENEYYFYYVGFDMRLRWKYEELGGKGVVYE